MRIWSGLKEDTIMKMPIKKSIKRFLVASILVSVGLPVIVVGGKKLFFYSSTQVHTFFTPEEATVTMHGIENKILIGRINQFVTNQIIKKSLLCTPPADLITMLQKAFPVLKNVTYQYQPPKTITFTLEGTKPTCLVNDHFIIGDHLTLIDKKDFTAETIAGLPRITIDKKWLSESTIPQHLYNFIHKLTPYHWTNFAITYHAPWRIALNPYQSICKATILTTEHTLFNTKKFATISPIFKDLCERGIITKKVLEAKYCTLVFDTRIKDQIIVRCNQPAKRGRGHG